MVEGGEVGLATRRAAALNLTRRDLARKYPAFRFRPCAPVVFVPRVGTEMQADRSAIWLVPPYAIRQVTIPKPAADNGAGPRGCYVKYYLLSFANRVPRHLPESGRKPDAVDVFLTITRPAPQGVSLRHESG